MGRYTQLYIGQLYFSWKGVIPAYLALPFGDEETYSTPDPGDPEHIYFGFNAQCGLVRERLDNFGFTLGFCQEVYEYFHADLCEDLAWEVEYELGHSSLEEPSESDIAGSLTTYLNSFATPSKAQQLGDLADLLRAAATGDPEQRYFSEPYVHRNEWLLRSERLPRQDLVLKGSTPANVYLGFQSIYSDHVSLDFQKLTEYLTNGFARYPPWLLALTLLFSYDYTYIKEYPEIIWLVLIRLAVEAVDDNATVRLELSDIVDDQEEARRIPTQLAQELVGKLRLYNTCFSQFLKDETWIRSRYMKSECARLLAECDATQSTYEKGRALELLVEMLFTANGTLNVAQKRVSTDDEEIDLVVKNNIDQPFWLAFGSPLFFVECKNWAKPVGSSSIRDFEVKVQNHNRLVKLGFFVSIGGFTSEVHSEMKRLGRDEYHIVLMDRSDFAEYLDSPSDFYDWLQTKVARLY